MTHPNDIDDALRLTLDRLTRTPDLRDRLDIFQNAVIEAGGEYLIPRPGDNWGPHAVELSLHGISHTGETEERALAGWITAATRVLRAEAAARRAAEVLTGDMRGIAAEDLRQAAECVRLNSTDPVALARAAQITSLIATGALK